MQERGQRPQPQRRPEFPAKLPAAKLLARQVSKRLDTCIARASQGLDTQRTSRDDLLGSVQPARLAQGLLWRDAMHAVASQRVEDSDTNRLAARADARCGVAALIYSSEFSVRTDDKLKDEDNAGWLLTLPAPERADWLAVLQWIRLPDRLLERETLDGVDATTPAAYGYADFMQDWRSLRAGRLPLCSPFVELFASLSDRWRRENLAEDELRAWDSYLEALWRYRYPDAVIHTDADYEAALCRMSGPCFQALPGKPRGLHDAAGALGAIDQFFNNLRDFEEDTRRGICYFSSAQLQRFGLRRNELAGLVGSSDARLVALYECLLSKLVPTLQKRASKLLEAPGLSAAWRELRHQVGLRHSRIEYVARRCRFNALAFQQEYWPLVAQDLAFAARRND